MRHGLALDILDLRAVPDEREVFEELLDELVFDVREYFLRQPVITELYRSRIRKLQQFNEAAETLGFPEEGDLPVLPDVDFHNAKALDVTFDLHQKKVSEIRLMMSGTLKPRALSLLAERLTEVQDGYEARLLEQTSSFKTEEGYVKANEASDSGRLAWLLKHSPDEFTRALARERRRIKLIHERRGLL